MGNKRWKVWFTGRNAGREDIVRALEKAGCEVTLGRFFSDTWNSSDFEKGKNAKNPSQYKKCYPYR